MGRSHSKEKTPNNPFEANVEQTKKEQKRIRKIKKKQKLEDEKKKRKFEKQSKLDKCKPPTAPQISRIHTDYETRAKDRIKHQLENDSETFLLNQLMLSIQFFGNYEREMVEAVERNRKSENEETSKIAQHSKTVVLPDRIHEAIDRKVKFQPRHGPKKILTSLHNQTLYIVHDNIEITHPGETTVYSIITDAPVYKFEIELPKQQGRRKSLNYHAGYIKLKSLEPIKMYDVTRTVTEHQKPNTSLNHVNETNDNSDESDSVLESAIPTISKFRDSIMIHAKSTVKSAAKKPIGYLNGMPLSINSTCSTSPTSSEYDYAYITSLNLHQPLSVMRGNDVVETFSAVILTDSCITKVIEPIYASQNEYSSAGEYSNDSSDSEVGIHDDEKMKNSSNIQYSMEEKQYLNSKAFLSYFINLFQDELAKNLGFSKSDLEQATWKGSIIYMPSWEVVPAISCPWLKEATIGFENNLNSSNSKFQWPTIAMKQKIRTLGCHVVPVGYTPKMGGNLQKELEWKIVFPEAERYLESCLTNGQAKMYMVTKTLIKTFIDPHLEDRFNMFTVEHIRTHLFWECEANYIAWSEEHLGESLLRFLNSFLARIKTHNLPDYFMKRRNLFDNIPERILAELHKKIYRITENPVMHLLIALRNLKYSKEFYPKLNYRKLYSTIIVDNPYKIINPQFIKAEEKSFQIKNDEDVAFGSMAHFERKERQSRRRRTKMVRFMEAEKIKKDSEVLEARRASVESIDVKIKIPKCLEEMRRKIILELFLRHFLEMSKMSYQQRANRLTVSYVKQVERLLYVMQDDHIHLEDANDVSKEIDSLRLNAITAITNENIEPPELPSRDSTDGRGNKSKHKKKNHKPLKISVNRYTNVDTIVPFSPVSFDDESNRDHGKHKKITNHTPTIREENEFSKPNEFITNVMVHQKNANSSVDAENMSPTNKISVNLNELLGNVNK